MSINPTANWDRVGDRFYRKIQLYTAVFDQDLELENYTIAGAPYSGAVSVHLKKHFTFRKLTRSSSLLSVMRRNFKPTAETKPSNQA